MLPIEIYIKRSKNTTEVQSRLTSFGVSVSASGSSRFDETTELSPIKDAPYPAFLTADITLSGASVPSTFIEFVKRLTVHEVTPGSFETSFSTLALHAAQLIPVTLYLSKFIVSNSN